MLLCERLAPGRPTAGPGFANGPTRWPFARRADSEPGPNQQTHPSKPRFSIPIYTRAHAIYAETRRQRIESRQKDEEIQRPGKRRDTKTRNPPENAKTEIRRHKSTMFPFWTLTPVSRNAQPEDNAKKTPEKHRLKSTTFLFRALEPTPQPTWDCRSKCTGRSISSCGACNQPNVFRSHQTQAPDPPQAGYQRFRGPDYGQ